MAETRTRNTGVLSYVPGLLLMGLGIGIRLTASVNLVQSAWPEELQGDVSGPSRGESNLGSSMGTALAGSVLVGAVRPGGGPFALALVVLAACALIGFFASVLLPKHGSRAAAETALS